MDERSRRRRPPNWCCFTAVLVCLIAPGCIRHNVPDDLTAVDLEQAAAAPNPPVAQVPVSPYARQGAQAWAGDSAQASGRPAVAQPAAATTLETALAEVEAMADVDAETKQRLIADLRQTDPSLHPLLLQTFRAGAAYRRKEPPAARQAPAVTAVAPAEATKPEQDKPSVVQTGFTQAAASEQLPLDAIAAQLTGAQSGAPQLLGRGGGGQLPTQAILTAALAEAQRREAEQRQTPPPLEQPDEKQVAAEATPAVASNDAPPKAESAAKPATSATAGDWRKNLEATIVLLEEQTKEPPASAAEVSRHAWLRMLYLTAGRRDDALKPIPGISAAEQDYWREQLYALATCLDTERQTDSAKRAAEARLHLAKADSRLGETGTLVVRNLNFCEEVSSYGVYKKFDEYKFKATQPLILYAEVQNFKSEESSKGFHTALRSSYQILDAQGRRVAENDLALTEEYCRNERRDYFLRYFLSVPERIYDGNYTLQLTIVDTLSQKIGTATIDFTVGEKK
ncbi:MAG: hypothetical protein JNK76_07745 [Planctomycetales bacterium]|nr:hypothetical protein [Planctomycetales bacterium]MBN8624445.1 hypothetical protein [Planctomycetota bacterium]